MLVRKEEERGRMGRERRKVRKNAQIKLPWYHQSSLITEDSRERERERVNEIKGAKNSRCQCARSKKHSQLHVGHWDTLCIEVLLHQHQSVLCAKGPCGDVKGFPHVVVSLRGA